MLPLFFLRILIFFLVPCKQGTSGREAGHRLLYFIIFMWEIHDNFARGCVVAAFQLNFPKRILNSFSLIFCHGWGHDLLDSRDVACMHHLPMHIWEQSIYMSESCLLELWRRYDQFVCMHKLPAVYKYVLLPVCLARKISELGIMHASRKRTRKYIYMSTTSYSIYLQIRVWFDTHFFYLDERSGKILHSDTAKCACVFDQDSVTCQEYLCPWSQLRPAHGCGSMQR